MSYEFIVLLLLNINSHLNTHHFHSNYLKLSLALIHLQPSASSQHS